MSVAAVTVTSIVGGLTVILSILVKIIGFPDQMRKNHKRKSVEGVSRPFYILSFVTYVVWTLYGILKHDTVVALGQGLGVLTTGIILYQMVLYRRKKSSE